MSRQSSIAFVIIIAALYFFGAIPWVGAMVLLVHLLVIILLLSILDRLTIDRSHEIFPDSRTYPLKIFVAGEPALWCLSAAAVDWWEKALFEEGSRRLIAIPVSLEEQADIVISVQDYKDSQRKELTFGFWKLPVAGYTRWPARFPGEPVAVVLHKGLRHISLFSVLRHELGHALCGLGHNLDKRSIMFGGSESRRIGEGVVTSENRRLAISYLGRHGVSVP